MTQSMVEHLRAVPLLGIHAFGIASGPRLENPATRLGQWRLGGQAAWVAARTAGVTGIQLLQVIATLGGEATRAQIEKQTPGLGADDLDRELSRLAAGELIVLRPDGAAALRPQSENLVHEVAPSMASDHTPITSDALAGICRTLGIKPPMRKRSGSTRSPTSSPTPATPCGSVLSCRARPGTFCCASPTQIFTTTTCTNTHSLPGWSTTVPTTCVTIPVSTCSTSS